MKKTLATGVLGLATAFGLNACGDDITKNYASDASAVVDGDTLTITEVVKKYDTVTVSEVLKSLDTLKTTIVLKDTVTETDTLTSTVLVRDTIRDTIKVEVVPESPTEDLVYGTVDVSYAQFFYGDINDVDPEFAATEGNYAASAATADEYDVYTSASKSKGASYLQSNFSTDAADIPEVEGAQSVFLGLKAVNVAINKALLEDVKNSKETDSDLYKLVNAATWDENATAPVTYKVINSDGTLSKTQGKVAVRSVDASSIDLVQIQGYGNYQVNLPGYLLNEASTDNVQGIIIETDAGNKYALRALANIWLDVREFAFATAPFTLSHGGQAVYEPYKDVDGKFIKKITYLLKDESSVEISTDLYVPLNSDVTAGKCEIKATSGKGGMNYSVAEGSTFEATSQFTAGDTIVFQVENVARAAALKLSDYGTPSGKTVNYVGYTAGGAFSINSKLVIFDTDGLAAGTYTFKFEDASGIQLAKTVTVTVAAAPESSSSEEASSSSSAGE